MELFSFLTSKVVKSIFHPIKLCMWHQVNQYYLSAKLISSMMPDCNHEEADTRVIVHILHALEQGIKSIVVQTMDTNVIVLADVFFELTANKPLAGIWVAFGTGKNFRMYSSYQCYLHLPWWGKSTSITNISCPDRLWHYICIQRQRQEIRVASLAGLRRSH